MRLTAQEVYDKLVNEDGILQLEGQIKFYLGDVNIIVKQRDVVGNIMQEWLQGWLDKRGIEYAPSENTQMPPDFFLNPDDKTKNLLEVKAFNRNRGPGIWYAEDTARTDYTVFESLEDFISAIEETVFQNPKTHNNAGTWKATFLRSYKQETGIDLSIPRWSEIKDKYDLKSVRKLEKAKSDLAKATDQYEKIKERIQLYHRKLHAEQEKNNVGKVGKIQDDIEKQKRNAEKAKEKINKAQAKIDELEG